MSELWKELMLVAILILAVQGLSWLSFKITKSYKIRSKLLHVIERSDSWWVILILLSLAFYFDKGGLCVLFGFVSFFALREFVTLVSASPSDHRPMFWMFFIVLPLQYFAIYEGWTTAFYYLVPLFALIFLPFRAALVGDPNRFLDRTASLQWGLMTAVFCVSFLPAILLVKIPGFHRNSELLLYFVLITQINDVIQHETGLWFGKYKIAPNISRLRTWEGWVLGAILTTALGGLLTFMTPFDLRSSLVIAFICTQLGFAGSFVMSAVKRSRGIQTFDELIPGHGGTLDRIDSIVFAAPVFFHILNKFYLR